jgi:hypothetical protein
VTYIEAWSPVAKKAAADRLTVKKDDPNMLNKIITALSSAIVLSSATAAMAAPRHAIQHRTAAPTVEEQEPGAVQNNYCSNPRNGPGFGTEPNYMAIQDEDECESN